MLEKLPSAKSISDFQRRRVALWHQDPPTSTSQDPFFSLVEENSLQNFILWHHEDEARRDDQGHEHVYQAKRAIDAANQKRNDFVEKMDQFLFSLLQNKISDAEKMNTETPGMAIDRLSILSLKEYHMREETERDDASQEHREACRTKLNTIIRQIEDLREGLQSLLEDCSNGERGFRVYFQFKMYNDPSLNPALYKKK